MRSRFERAIVSSSLPQPGELLLRSWSSTASVALGPATFGGAATLAVNFISGAVYQDLDGMIADANPNRFRPW